MTADKRRLTPERRRRDNKVAHGETVWEKRSNKGPSPSGATLAILDLLLKGNPPFDFSLRCHLKGKALFNFGNYGNSGDFGNSYNFGPLHPYFIPTHDSN